MLCLAPGLAKLYLHDLETLETVVTWTAESIGMRGEPLRDRSSEQSTFLDFLSH